MFFENNLSSCLCIKLFLTFSLTNYLNFLQPPDDKKNEIINTIIIPQSLPVNIKPTREVHYREKLKQNKVDLEKSDVEMPEL